jgi:hypothetical protein
MQTENINKKIVPICMMVMSLISLMHTIPMKNYLSIIVSLIGIVAGYLYLKQGKPMNHLTELWLIAQVPFLEKTVFDMRYTDGLIVPIYDVSQVFKLPLYLHFSTHEYMIKIGFNALPLIIIGFLIYFKIRYQMTHTESE